MSSETTMEATLRTRYGLAEDVPLALAILEDLAHVNAGEKIVETEGDQDIYSSPPKHRTRLDIEGSDMTLTPCRSPDVVGLQWPHIARIMVQIRFR